MTKKIFKPAGDRWTNLNFICSHLQNNDNNNHKNAKKTVLPSNKIRPISGTLISTSHRSFPNLKAKRLAKKKKGHFQITKIRLTPTCRFI